MGPQDVGCEHANKAGAQSRDQDVQAHQRVSNQQAVSVLSSLFHHEENSPERLGS